MTTDEQNPDISLVLLVFHKYQNTEENCIFTRTDDQS